MSSHKYEVDHQRQLRELLSQAGLECLRPPPPSVTSVEEEVLETAEEIQDEEEIESERDTDKEQMKEESEIIIEETPEEVFPTPSLRRLIPEQQRRIEELNRIEVLPAKFITNFAPEAIPIIVQTPLAEVIDILGNMTGCRSYKTNLAEYWFLDTMANLLRRAQDDQMDKGSQAVLMSWFCEWMREMQHFDAADRQRMIRRFQDNITAAAKFIAEHHRLPTPEDVGVVYESGATQGQAGKANDEAKPTDGENKSVEETKNNKGEKGREDDKDKNNNKGGKDNKDKSKKKRDNSPGKKPDKSKKDSPGKKSEKSVGKDKKGSPKGKGDGSSRKGDGSSRKGDGSSRKGDGSSRKGDGSIRKGDEDRSEGAEDENPESFECALIDLTNIAHYIYDLFSTDYQYNLVRSVFTFSPEYVHVDAPNQMRVPKTLLLHQPKPKADKQLEDSTRTSVVSKKDKSIKQLDDYVALLELQQSEERHLAEQESKDRAEWQRRSHILPLNAAVYNDHSPSDNSDRREGR